MPIMIQFTKPVTDRAAVERALTVASTPRQAGHWSWMSDTRVDWRPQNYWQPGTKVQVRLNLDGVPAGAGKYGGSDTAFDFTVGRQQISVVDLHKHEMTVYQDDKPVQTFPITGGKPATTPGAARWRSSTRRPTSTCAHSRSASGTSTTSPM